MSALSPAQSTRSHSFSLLLGQSGREKTMKRGRKTDLVHPRIPHLCLKGAEAVRGRPKHLNLSEVKAGILQERKGEE